MSQSESRLAASRSTLADAEGALEISRQNYRQAVGTLPGDLERAPPLPQVPAVVQDAIDVGVQRNPRIISAQFSERSAVYDFDRALAAKGLTVGASVAVGAERENQTGWDSDAFGEVGIEASVPLYSGGRNDSVVRQAQALLDQRRFELQDEGRAVTQEVAAAWFQLDVARASIIARREQVEAARIAAEGVAEEARLGARSTLDVLDADQERLQAEAEVVQALRDEYVATYALLQAMGLLTVEHLKLGIETYDPDVYFNRCRAARAAATTPRPSTGSGRAGSATERCRSKRRGGPTATAGAAASASRNCSPRCWPRSGRWSRPRPRRGSSAPARRTPC